MSVGKCLKVTAQDLIVCHPKDKLQYIAKLLNNNHISAMPVCDHNGEVIGVISERDILRAVDNCPYTFMDKSVQEFMTEKVISCNSETTLNQAMQKMVNRDIRHLVVLDEHNLVGMISMGDLLSRQIQSRNHELDVLRDCLNASRHH